MFGWMDLVVVNALSLAAFAFYFIAAIRYGVKRNWKSSVLMVAFSTVPWLVMICLTRICLYYCIDMWGVWITLGAMKIAFCWTCGACIACVQFLPIRCATLPSLFVGLGVAAVGTAFSLIELFGRIDL